jgi:hypothetical protein
VVVAGIGAVHHEFRFLVGGQFGGGDFDEWIGGGGHGCRIDRLLRLRRFRRREKGSTGIVGGEVGGGKGKVGHIGLHPCGEGECRGYQQHVQEREHHFSILAE